MRERGRAEKEPLISVVMPFYNVGEYLREAVESVRRQSYTRWELILVDDGSMDESLQIARQLVDSDPRLCCLQHEDRANKGASASRNLGLARAGGDYIAFLDSDDVWVSDKLAHQVDLLNQYPGVGMICGASQYWSSWSDPNVVDRVVQVGCRPNTLFQPLELARILYPLERRHAPSMNGLLAPRGVVEAVGGFVDGFRGMYDDQVFLTKIYLSYSVYVTDKVYDRYRQNRAGSVCHLSGISGDYLTHRLRYLQWLRAYLIEKGIEDRGIDRRLLREEWRCRFPALHNCLRRLDRQKKVLKRMVRAAWNQAAR